MTVTVLDKEFLLFITKEEIKLKIAEVATQIRHDYQGKQPLFICILNGVFVFAADLYREINIQAPISFVKLASYQGAYSTGQVKSLIGLNEDIEGKDVLIIEDIIDTGRSLEYSHQLILERRPASIKVVTLLYKPEAYLGNVNIDYSCFHIPNNFVVGYGMDYDGMGRHLSDIYSLV